MYQMRAGPKNRGQNAILCLRLWVMETVLAGEITALLKRWKDGDAAAQQDLLGMVYPDLRRLARARLRGNEDLRMSPTELVHESFLRLAGGSLPDWANRQHFFSISSRLMRLALIDFVREQKAAKRGGGATVEWIEDSNAATPPMSIEILELNEALNELEQFDGRKARVLEMRFFGGLSIEEIALAAEASVATVNRDLRAGTAWLRMRLGSGKADDAA
jgi:RNA polymerase sigma-70 factor, ECF subfamily